MDGVGANRQGWDGSTVVGWWLSLGLALVLGCLLVEMAMVVVEGGNGDSGADRREEKWTVVVAGVGDAQELGAVRGSGFDSASGDG